MPETAPTKAPPPKKKLLEKKEQVDLNDVTVKAGCGGKTCGEGCRDCMDKLKDILSTLSDPNVSVEEQEKNREKLSVVLGDPEKTQALKKYFGQEKFDLLVESIQTGELKEIKESLNEIISAHDKIQELADKQDANNQGQQDLSGQNNQTDSGQQSGNDAAPPQGEQAGSQGVEPKNADLSSSSASNTEFTIEKSASPSVAPSDLDPSYKVMDRIDLSHFEKGVFDEKNLNVPEPIIQNNSNEIRSEQHIIAEQYAIQEIKPQESAQYQDAITATESIKVETTQVEPKPAPSPEPVANNIETKQTQQSEVVNESKTVATTEPREPKSETTAQNNRQAANSTKPSNREQSQFIRNNPAPSTTLYQQIETSRSSNQTPLQQKISVDAVARNGNIASVVATPDSRGASTEDRSRQLLAMQIAAQRQMQEARIVKALLNNGVSPDAEILRRHKQQQRTSSDKSVEEKITLKKVDTSRRLPVDPISIERFSRIVANVDPQKLKDLQQLIQSAREVSKPPAKMEPVLKLTEVLKVEAKPEAIRQRMPELIKELSERLAKNPKETLAQIKAISEAAKENAQTSKAVIKEVSIIKNQYQMLRELKLLNPEQLKAATQIVLRMNAQQQELRIVEQTISAAQEKLQALINMKNQLQAANPALDKMIAQEALRLSEAMLQAQQLREQIDGLNEDWQNFLKELEIERLLQAGIEVADSTAARLKNKKKKVVAAKGPDVDQRHDLKKNARENAKSGPMEGATSATAKDQKGAARQKDRGAGQSTHLSHYTSEVSDSAAPKDASDAEEKELVGAL